MIRLINIGVVILIITIAVCTITVLQSYRPYFDLFADTWKAFSRYPVMRLSDFEGKRVSELADCTCGQ